jgi:DNA-binding NtrC family response regulator
LPPLRERGEDIITLAEEMLRRAASKHRLEVSRLADDTRDALKAYGWPGNVRELERVIETAAALADGPALTKADLPDRFRNTPKSSRMAARGGQPAAPDARPAGGHVKRIRFGRVKRIHPRFVVAV